MGASVDVPLDDLGAPRLIDVRSWQSSAPQLLDTLATLERGDNGLLACFNAAFDVPSFVEAASKDDRFSLIESSDGQVSNVLHRHDPSDRSARTDSFDFHNDGLYLAQPPDYCALYCLDPGNGNIPTIFVDSRHVVQRLSSAGVSLQILSRLKQMYVDRRGVRHMYNIVRSHPKLGHTVLQYYGEGELVASALQSCSLEGNKDLQRIKDVVYRCISECNWNSLFWEKGKFVVWDNYAFLHARLTTKIDLRRHLARFWIRRAASMVT